MCTQLYLLTLTPILFLLTFLPLKAGTTEITLCGIQGARNHEIAFAVLKEAYASLDITLKEMPMPPKRSLITSSAGILCSGEVQRIEEVGNLYPTLKKVPEPILLLEGYAFVVNPEVKINHLEDVKKYVVGIPRGIVNLAQLTKGMNRVFVAKHNQLFDILESNRVDVVFASKPYWEQYLLKNKGTNIRMVPTPVTVKNVYHFLNENHSELIQKVDVVLKSMKKDGRYDKIVNSFN